MRGSLVSYDIRILPRIPRLQDEQEAGSFLLLYLQIYNFNAHLRTLLHLFIILVTVRDESK